ncbi:MAG: signal peptidase I [Clostridia bacterium]|nr:signal peptidase I [Clostridia bacterium]
MNNENKQINNEEKVNNNNKKENSVTKKKYKKVKNIIEYIIIFLVIFVNAFLIFQSVRNPSKTPSVAGKKAFVIISGSMIPKIQIGDVVIINETNDVKVDDIIAFRRDSTVIVHRIIKQMEVNGKIMFQTKGDNNNVADSELVEIETLEGKYVGKIPYIGKFLMLLYNNLTLVIVAAIFILIIKYYLTKNK